MQSRLHDFKRNTAIAKLRRLFAAADMELLHWAWRVLAHRRQMTARQQTLAVKAIRQLQTFWARWVLYSTHM